MEITKIIIISFFKNCVSNRGGLWTANWRLAIPPRSRGDVTFNCQLLWQVLEAWILKSWQRSLLSRCAFVAFDCRWHRSLADRGKSFFYFSSVHIFLGISFCYSLYVNWYWEISSKQVVEKKYCESSVCARAIFLRRESRVEYYCADSMKSSFCIPGNRRWFLYVPFLKLLKSLTEVLRK